MVTERNEAPINIGCAILAMVVIVTAVMLLIPDNRIIINWNLPEPNQTQVIPDKGSYEFTTDPKVSDLEFSFSVDYQEMGNYIQFSYLDNGTGVTSACTSEIESGCFLFASEGIYEHEPGYEVALSGSFVNPKKAVGKIQIAKEGKVVSSGKFTAILNN